MPRLNLSLLAIIAVIVLSGCANSSGLHNSSRNQVVSEFYATVETVDTVQFESHVGEGAAIGAVDGFLSNVYGDSRDRLYGAVFGAFFGALVTSIAEGDTTGYRYQLQDLNGEYLTVVLDDKDALLGDCVIVTLASEVYLELVSPHNCYDYIDN